MAEQPTAHAPIDQLLTVHDLGAYGLTPTRARKLFSQRLIPIVEMGPKLLYVRRSDFEAYLDASKQPAQAFVPKPKMPASEHPARVWGREHGYDVPHWGRLSPALLAAWNAAGSPEPGLHSVDTPREDDPK